MFALEADMSTSVGRWLSAHAAWPLRWSSPESIFDQILSALRHLFGEPSVDPHEGRID
jgi:hypothetical protein